MDTHPLLPSLCCSVQFSRLWGLRGTAVDQPQDGGGDGILPTLLTLPNDATTKKGHASIKVRANAIWSQGRREGVASLGRRSS